MTSAQRPLGEVIQFLRGITFKPEEKVERDARDAVVCMRTKNIQEELDESDLIAVPSALVKRDELYLREGDILLSSANSWNLVGKVCRVPRLRYRATAGGFISVVRPLPSVDGRYVYHWLASPTVQAWIRSCARQTTNIANLSVDQFEKLKIPVPAPDEQRRIADILDKADAIRRKRKETITLTEELLRSTFLEMFGDPVTNPKGWPVRPLGELVDIRGGGTPSRARADYFEGTIPWATAKDFQSDFMSETQEHVSDEAVAGSATQLVPVGTVLVVVKSKILMRRLPVAITRVLLCFNQDVKGLVAYDQSESVYIAAHLRLAQRKLLDLARGANTEGLTVAHLRSHLVMRPPASRIRDFTAFETIVRNALEKEREGLGRSEDLFNGLIAGAFRGELRVAEAAC